MTISNPNIAKAQPSDIPQLEVLLNAAYRGEESKKGWTTEEHLISGNTRTNQEELLQILQTPHNYFLKYTNENGRVVGCVNLQQKPDGLYLGMLCVWPELQGGGVGKQLLQAAEEVAQQCSVPRIFMTVISLREELIAWYVRHGYQDTGLREPFPEDGLSGKHLVPLEFVVLERLMEG